jgi:adenylate cyclase
MGIGIHSGEAIVGNIGSKRRVKWGGLGDPVNIAARIESLTVGTQVLLSDAVLEAIPRAVSTDDQRSVQVKGRTQALQVSTLHSIVGEDLAMPGQSAVIYRDVTYAAQVATIDDKVVSERTIEAYVTRFGGHRITFRSDVRFEDGADIVLRLSLDEGQSEPVYGKVKSFAGLDIEGEQTSAYVTSIDPGTRRRLESVDFT